MFSLGTGLESIWDMAGWRSHFKEFFFCRKLRFLGLFAGLLFQGNIHSPLQVVASENLGNEIIVFKNADELLQVSRQIGSSAISSPLQHALSTTREMESRGKVSKFVFEDEAARESFTQTLDAMEVEWEYNQSISATSDPLFNLDGLDPLFSQQWSLLNLTGSSSNPQVAGASIDVVRAWNIARGKGRLYVVDTGVDPDSVEFEGIPFLMADFINEGGEHDGNGHGSHVASIAVARQNTVGTIGVAPGSDVELVSVKVLNAQSNGSTFAAIAAMDAIHDSVREYFSNNPDGFVVINMSLGGTGYSAQFERGLQRISRLGARDGKGPRVLIVTAAGNNSSNNDEEGFYPCGFIVANLICVAASDRLDFKANFSNYGSQSVHLFAPGVQILGYASGALAQAHGMFVRSSGTSQAAPHVAGAALLVHEANPDLDASEVKTVLLGSVDYLPGASAEVLSAGRLNAYRAVLVASGQDPELATRLFESRPASAAGGGAGGCQLGLANASSAGISFGWFILFGFLLGISRWYSERVFAGPSCKI
jgi:hypothetical protein